MITCKKTQIPCCPERIMMISTYVHTQERSTYKQMLLHNVNLLCFCTNSLLSLPASFSCTLQVLSLCPKATRWVYPSRRSPCWAWYQTPQRCSALYQAVFPCWAPLPSTRLPWLRSRDDCHPLSASTRHSWEAFYAGQNLFNLTASYKSSLYDAEIVSVIL